MEQQIDEKKKQKIKLNRMQWTIIIGLLVMVGVLVYALVKNNRVSGSYEVVTSLSRGDDTSVYYQIMRKGMIRYSKDGMAMTDKSGNLIWTQTYEMTSPAIAVSDPYVAVGILVPIRFIFLMNTVSWGGLIQMCLYRKSGFLHKGLLQRYFQIRQRIISIYTINRAMFSEASKHLFRTQATHWPSRYLQMRHAYWQVISAWMAAL